MRRGSEKKNLQSGRKGAEYSHVLSSPSHVKGRGRSTGIHAVRVEKTAMLPDKEELTRDAWHSLIPCNLQLEIQFGLLRTFFFTIKSNTYPHCTA